MPFVVGNQEHVVGDRRCGECWSGYPKVCRCKGLIHAQFIKESWDGEKHLEFKCDYCGADFRDRFDGQPPRKPRLVGKKYRSDRQERSNGRRFRRK